MYHLVKQGIRKATAVGGAKEPSSGSEAGGCERDQIAVMIFSPEDRSALISGKRRRIEDDSCEEPLLSAEAS